MLPRDLKTWLSKIRELTIPECAVHPQVMALVPIQLIRQLRRSSGGRCWRRALGWALDAFDAMLYALVLALLMRDLGMSKTKAGPTGHAHSAGFQDRRSSVGFWPTALVASGR